MADLTLAAIPHVLDDDELPFVLGPRSDTRRCLEAGGAEYRRGTDRVTIDWKLGDLRLRSIVIHAEGISYLMASAGPILSEWWPLLRREGGNPSRPLLSAAVTSSAQTIRSADYSVQVSIVPPSPDFEMTTAVLGIEQATGLTDGCLIVTHAYSLGVIKAALLVLDEYRTLVDPVPDLDLEVGGVQLPLATMLDVAKEAATAIAWTHSVG